MAKRYETKSAKGTGPWGGLRKTDMNFHSLLLMEWCSMSPVPPAMSCDHTCGSWQPELLVRGSAGGSWWQLITQAHPALYMPKLQTPRRKAGTQHKAHSLHSLGALSYPISEREGRSSEIHISSASLRTNLVQEPFQDSRPTRWPLKVSCFQCKNKNAPSSFSSAPSSHLVT